MAAQQIMRKQDTQLQEVGATVGVLSTMGRTIADELDDQNRLLDEMESEIETTTERLKRTIDKVDKVLAISKGAFPYMPGGLAANALNSPTPNLRNELADSLLSSSSLRESCVCCAVCAVDAADLCVVCPRTRRRAWLWYPRRCR